MATLYSEMGAEQGFLTVTGCEVTDNDYVRMLLKSEDGTIGGMTFNLNESAIILTSVGNYLAERIYGDGKLNLIDQRGDCNDDKI